jgi:hypothetical protein
MLQRISMLAGGCEVRDAAVARWLVKMPAEDAVRSIEEMLSLSAQRFLPCVELMPSLMRVLAREKQLFHLHRVAALHDISEVEALFFDGPAHLEYDSGEARRADERRFREPLGVLKAKARLTTNIDEMERLALSSHPHVMQEMLKNPRLTETNVIRMAARRPARPEPLTEIARSPKWSMRPGVRRALAFNPYLPLEVGAKLVPLLSLIDWKELLTVVGVHEQVKAQVQGLLEKHEA